MKISDLGNSFNKIFEERISSPLYGTFIISWLIWNWKIVYLTIFVSQDNIQPSNKIQYILDNYINWWVLIAYPLASTILLITAIPWGANKLYKVHLFYERERTRDKEKSDAEKRLTIEQSAEVRNEMMTLVENHQKQIDSKINDIKIIKLQLDSLVQSRKEFKVLYAQYGKNGIYNDVTKTVSEYVIAEESFLVKNEVLGGDPLWSVAKELVIIYQFENEIHSLFAKEHYEIEVKTNKGQLIAKETEEAKTLYINEALAQNRITLGNLFPGKWNLRYSGVDSQGVDIQGQEEVELKEGYKYFAKGPSETSFTHRFNLEDIQINNREIIFTKISVEGEKRVAPSVLQVMKMGQSYEGIEMGGSIKVYYSKSD